MYCDTAAVRVLCKNVTSTIDATEIAEAAARADSLIDDTLSSQYYWPKDPQGVDLSATPPAAVVQIANTLTAGYIEQKLYAQNESGGLEANPYGRSLIKQGTDRLKSICSSGGEVVRGLTRFSVTRQSKPTSTFAPVHGLRGGRGRSY